MNPTLAINLSNAIKLGEPATVWAQVVVTAADAPVDQVVERKPMDLYLVIDRSGSMQIEQRLENAKKAVQYVLSQLTGADRASVIIYDDIVEVLSPLSSDHQSAIRAVNRITDRNMTALAPALYQAMETAREHGEGRTKHVFLLSDGNANVGHKNPDVIASHMAPHVEAGVRVSTFGLGNQFNEELMEQIAVAGQGGYHYLASADDAPAAFAKELDDLMRVTLRDARLDITPAPGVIIESLLGTDTSVDKTIMLGDVPAGAERMFLAKLRVGANRDASRTLIDVKLRGRTGLDGSGTADLAQPAVAAQLTDDAAVAAAVNVAVLARVAEMEAAEVQREAAAAADARDYTRARSLLSDTRNRVSSALQLAGHDPLLTAKLQQIDQNIAAVASDQTYTRGMSKSLKFASYATRTRR